MSHMSAEAFVLRPARAGRLNSAEVLTLTIAPVLLGAGKRLFDGMSRPDLAFERTAVIGSPYATHA